MDLFTSHILSWLDFNKTCVSLAFKKINDRSYSLKKKFSFSSTYGNNDQIYFYLKLLPK